MLAVFFSFSVAVFPAFSAEPFPDVPDTNTYQRSIEYLHSEGIVRGDDATGYFRPADNLNRAEFATILVRVLGKQPTSDTYKNCFPDVEEEWFAPYVCQARDLGLVKGYSAGEMAGLYGPAEPLYNSEIIEVMSRLAKWEMPAAGEVKWYEPSWNYAGAHKIIEGQLVGSKTGRGLMAEIIFRTAAVKYGALSEYDPIKAGEYIDAEMPIVGLFETVDSSRTLVISGMALPAQEAAADQKDVPLFKFSGIVAAGGEDAELRGIRFYLADVTETRNLSRVYLKSEKSGQIVYERDLRLKTIPSPFITMFDTPLVFNENEELVYTLYGDLDFEESTPLHLYVSKADDLNSDAAVEAAFPLDGSKVVRDPDFYSRSEDPAMNPQCASWDGEYNLPYPSQNETLLFETAKPAEDGGSVVPGENAHAVWPIDQGNKGICAAAATYSSLRWLEDVFSIELITDGQEGLDALADGIYGQSGGTAIGQYNAEKAYLEGLSKCISVEYDTQAGLNVACTELKAYKDKQCDIPLAFYCDKIDPATGAVITGAGAEKWGHTVDLVDIEIDAADDDKCSITFANSWRDPAAVGRDLDGLGMGRYEKASYNDDDTSFAVQSPWGANYKCTLDAAIYVCVDKTKC